MINKDGVIGTDPADIAEIQKEQYEKVFSESKPEMKINDSTELFKTTKNTKKKSIFISITWM